MLRENVGLGFMGERLNPMVLKETPQSIPDRGLVVYVEPLINEAVQGHYVRPGQSHAETPLIGVVGQFTFHPFAHATMRSMALPLLRLIQPVLINGDERES